MTKVKLFIGGALLAVAMLFGINGLQQSTAKADDCSTNAVIKCGVNSISELRSRYNNDTTPGTRNIYAAYGLTSSIINSGTYKVGTTTKSGQVIVDGKVVANGAHSAGREYMSGSTKRVSNGTTFYDRPNSVSYRSNTISAMVFFDANGKFIAAVLYDCGNPVTATPVPVPPKPAPAKPVYSCDGLSKLEEARDQFQFTTAATAKNGATVKDYVYNFGDGKTATTGNKVSHTYAKPGTYTVTVTVRVTVNGVVKNAPGSCKTTVTVCPAPAYACDSLSASKISRTTFSYITKATAVNGAVVKDYTYNFGDGSSATTGSKVNHTYAKAGTYTATVTVRVVVAGKTVNATGNCKTTVTVTPEMCTVPGKEQYPKDDKHCFTDKPSVTIQKLVNGKDRASVAVNETFTYTVIVKNTGNVELKKALVSDPAPTGVTFVSTPLGTIKDNKWSYTIDSLAVGKSQSFTIVAKLPAYKAGEMINKACVDTPTVPGSPDACDSVPVDTPELIQVCNTNTKAIETINKNDFDASYMTTDLSKCESAPVPPELPHTGVSDTFISVLGLGSLVGTSLAYVASRRIIR